MSQNLPRGYAVSMNALYQGPARRLLAPIHDDLVTAHHAALAAQHKAMEGNPTFELALGTPGARAVGLHPLIQVEIKRLAGKWPKGYSTTEALQFFAIRVHDD